MLQVSLLNCNRTCLKKAHNFEKIVTMPNRVFSILKRIFPKRKTGTRKQRKFGRFSYENKFKRLTASAKAYARKTKLKTLIWNKKYGAQTNIVKSLLVPSWAQKMARKKNRYQQPLNLFKIKSHSERLLISRNKLVPSEKLSSSRQKKASFILTPKKGRVLRKKMDRWKQIISPTTWRTKKIWWELLLAPWNKHGHTLAKKGEVKSASKKELSYITEKKNVWIDWKLWAKKNKSVRAFKKTSSLHLLKKEHLRRLEYAKLGKRWKKKLRFWKYRRSRWKRFEHYRRFSVWRWNNLGKWASFQLYPYKIYRRIHQPFRFRKAKQLKKNRWFRILHKGYEQGFAINRQIRLRNQQQYTKLFSFFYGFARPQQIAERSRHFLRLRGSGPAKRNIWLSWLERRLDIVLCRIRLAPTIAVARILITRGYIWVNKKQEMNPQKRVQLWDVVEINKANLAFPRYWYLRNRFQRHAFKYRNLRYRYFYNQKAALSFGFMMKQPFDLDVPKKDLTSMAEVERLFLTR